MGEGLAATGAAIGTDADLVRRARDGDATAFERLVDHHFGRTHRIALAIVGDEGDAGDAVQEAFLHAWRELPRLRDPERFGAWLTRITVNACRTSLQRRRVRRIAVAPAADPDLEPMDPAPGLAERVAGQDALERAFERLAPGQRALLVLHHAEHTPLAELAASLGVDPKTVKSRLFEARRALERALEVELR